MGELGLGGGPPEPQVPPGPDEWMRRLGTLPLLYQPGERWLYNTGSDVLGVLVARAAGQPLDVFLRERVFEPLGMVDTGFATPHVDRLGSCYTTDPETGERVVYDAPDGQWAKPPAFPSGGGGLVSTVDDVHAFGRMLLSGGRLPDGSRLLSRGLGRGHDHRPARRARRRAGPSPDGSQGWGFGVGVQVRRTGLGPPVGSYGWDGGLGSSWANDPAERLVGVVLTTDMFTAAVPAAGRDPRLLDLHLRRARRVVAARRSSALGWHTSVRTMARMRTHHLLVGASMLAVSVVGIARPVAGDGDTTEEVEGGAHRTLVTDWDAIGTQAFTAAALTPAEGPRSSATWDAVSTR